MGRFKVWIEIEDEDGDSGDASFELDGASVATFDTLDEAIKFGNRLQDIGQEIVDGWFANGRPM